MSRCCWLIFSFSSVHTSKSFSTGKEYRLNPYIPQSVFMLGIASAQMQDLAFGLPSLLCVDSTTRLGGTGKLTLKLTFHVTSKDVKQLIPIPTTAEELLYEYLLIQYSHCILNPKTFAQTDFYSLCSLDIKHLADVCDITFPFLFHCICVLSFQQKHKNTLYLFDTRADEKGM